LVRAAGQEAMATARTRSHVGENRKGQAAADEKAGALVWLHTLKAGTRWDRDVAAVGEEARALV
jgi:hypothetical protein